ncbi:hypothetical protein [Gilvimarinus algae]|uniref:Uncharacterized protein n=1 Tax=Gilvimarinus algae TaxID=3058037 RepID=A0ABT8TDZ1_9GAMM|nr:hypothetical protein [Gilvimarinus sp. SDUM040014]MDO3380876.1 hypothetical protein [Gilvimarinus sp. SDUM040014]
MHLQAAIPTDRKGALSRVLGWLCLPLVLLSLALGAEARKSDVSGAEPRDLVHELLAVHTPTPVDTLEEPDHDVIRALPAPASEAYSGAALYASAGAPALKPIPAFIARAPPVLSL